MAASIYNVSPCAMIVALVQNSRPSSAKMADCSSLVIFGYNVLMRIKCPSEHLLADKYGVDLRDAGQN